MPQIYIYLFFSLFFLSFSFTFIIIIIIIAYVYVFSACTDLAEKHIRFPQGLSLFCICILEFFIFELLNCESS